MYYNRIYSTEKHEKYVTTLYEKPPTISTYSLYFSPLVEKQEWTHEAVNKFINFFSMYMKNDVMPSESKYMQYLSKNNEAPNIISYYIAVPNKHNQSSNVHFSYHDILHYTSFCYMLSNKSIINGSLEEAYLQTATDVNFYSHNRFFSSKEYQVKIKSSTIQVSSLLGIKLSRDVLEIYTNFLDAHYVHKLNTDVYAAYVEQNDISLSTFVKYMHLGTLVIWDDVHAINFVEFYHNYCKTCTRQITNKKNAASMTRLEKKYYLYLIQNNNKKPSLTEYKTYIKSSSDKKKWPHSFVMDFVWFYRKFLEEQDDISRKLHLDDVIDIEAYATLYKHNVEFKLKLKYTSAEVDMFMHFVKRWFDDMPNQEDTMYFVYLHDTKNIDIRTYLDFKKSLIQKKKKKYNAPILCTGHDYCHSLYDDNDDVVN